MNRGLFFEVESVRGVRELDFLNHSLAGFKPTRLTTFYRTVQQDTLRPDYISYKHYGTEQYWWFILLMNGISDVKEELKAGMTLEIPNILDVYDFYKARRIR